MHTANIVNGVDVDRLSGTIDAVTATPALARFQFRARNHWIEGAYSRTTIKDFYGAGQEDATRTEPFTVDTDEPPVLLGENRAPTTVEYVLHALAACVTGTIAYHAAARGIAVDGLETTIQGDLDLHGFLGLDSNVRPGYEQVRVTIKATGDFDDNQLAELASLTRYSPVRDIVQQPRPRRHRPSPGLSDPHGVRASSPAGADIMHWRARRTRSSAPRSPAARLRLGGAGAPR